MPCKFNPELFLPTRPVSILSKEDLPHPLGPMSAVSERGSNNEVSLLSMTRLGFLAPLALVESVTLSNSSR